MKCPECVKEGEKSRVYPGVSTTTSMSGERYYDEEGRLHVHDPNTTTADYTCSRGHKWTTTERHGTCWCETVKDAVFTDAEPEPRQPHSILDSMEALLGYPTEKK